MNPDFKAFSSCPLAFDPGSKFRYSISMDVVGHLVCVLSGGKALDTVMSERVFVPLEMTDTAGYHIEDDDMHKVRAPSQLACWMARRPPQWLESELF